MIARDYIPLALQFYPTDVPESEPVFLAFLNDARAEISLKAGITQIYTFEIDPEVRTYTMPVNQGIVSVSVESPTLSKYIPVPKLTTTYKTSPLANLYNIFEAYRYDPINHELEFIGLWKPSRPVKAVVRYIIYPRNLSSWDATEQDIPERFARAVGIAFAKRMASYDGNIDVANYLDSLILPEVGYANALVN